MTFFHFFFFSSRRRHTRSTRDWSSDVCSSDLWQLAPRAMYNLMQEARKSGLDVVTQAELLFITAKEVLNHRFLYLHGRDRSEERRVGKEWRARRSPYHAKKKTRRTAGDQMIAD